MVGLEKTLRILVEAEVDLIVIGGLAGAAHGFAARFTNDVDIVYLRTQDNLTRLPAALADYEPYHRGAPPELPFRWGALTIVAGLNSTLSTTPGAVDLLGEVAGGGRYEDLPPFSEEIQFLHVTARYVDLPTGVH
jgi:hypothetical protein